MIEKFEFLIALAREQHFGRAAEACGVTQPTLSAGLKQLEETLGVLLVQRGSRFLGFTPEGQRVLEWARRIAADTRAMRDELRALKRGLDGHLRLASVPTALPVVAALTTPYRGRHPDVSFTVLSRTSDEVLALLEAFEVDAGITYLDHEPVGRVRSVPLYQEHYCLVTSAAGALGGRAVLDWAELGDVPLCLLTPDMQNRRIVEQALRESGARLRVELESDSLVVLLTHVRTGRWASVMPRLLAASIDLPEAVRAVPVRSAARDPHVGLVFPQREPLSPLVTALVSETRRLVAGSETVFSPPP